MNWKLVNICYSETSGDYFKEYVSEDGKMGKQVWNDGYEEIFELAQGKEISP